MRGNLDSSTKELLGLNLRSKSAVDHCALCDLCMTFDCSGCYTICYNLR